MTSAPATRSARLPDVVAHGGEVHPQPGRAVELDHGPRLPGPVLADQHLGDVHVVGHQTLDHPLHPRGGAALDQHDGVGTQVGGGLGGGVLGRERHRDPVVGQAGRPRLVGRPGGGVALGHQDVDDPGRRPAHQPVELLAGRPEFGHVTEHGDAGPTRQVAERGQPGEDRAGCRVVGVVQHQAAGPAWQGAEATGQVGGPTQGVDGLGGPDPEVVTDRQGGQRGGHYPAGTQQRHTDGRPGPVVDEGEPRARGRRLDVGGREVRPVGPVGRPERHHRGGAVLGHGGPPADRRR